MAIAFDAAGANVVDQGSSPLTFSLTVGSSADRIIVVGVCTNDSADVITDITRDGQSFTKLAGGVNNSAPIYTALWYLVNPNSGAANVSVAWSGTHDVAAGAAAYSGVDQITSFGTVVEEYTTNDGSINVSSAADELVVDVTSSSANNDLIAGTGQTERYNPITSFAPTVAASDEAGAASVTMSWTGYTAYSSNIGVALKPASGGTPVDADTKTAEVDFEAMIGNMVKNLVVT